MSTDADKNTKNTELFADVAFPAAVREVFTYSLPSEINDLKPGMRVWVPLRGTMSIGMTVRVHQKKPEFKTRAVSEVLDPEPVMDADMLRLTSWMHRFYYAGWGETIQAALPAGLNFHAQTYVRVTKKKRPKKLTKEENEILDSILNEDKILLKDARKRWQEQETGHLARLKKMGLLVYRDEPELRVKPKTELVWAVNPEVSETAIRSLFDEHPEPKRPKWVQALFVLSEEKIPLPDTTAALSVHPELTTYTLGKLESEGFLIKEEREAKEPVPDYDYSPDSISELNEDQQKAVTDIQTAIDEQSFSNFLLYGITGSGKTEVYIHALKHVLSKNRGGLVLVPEIALTPQTVRRFYRIFGDRIAVLHSRLNDRERMNAWEKLRRGEKQIAIGPRSAIFAPVQNPGIIILDEEHDTSYRQMDPAPRYHAREVAAMRAFFSNAVLVSGSATPSLVSLMSVTQGRTKMIKLRSRHAGAMLPQVKILDLKQYRYAMKGPVAVPLYEKIQHAIASGEQIILLYNRRGFANYIQCESCGSVAECPDCSVTLTYHKPQHHLRCHYCGYTSGVQIPHGECGEDPCTPKLMGQGTQLVEEELEEVFPDARILRMDQDTTSRKDAHEKLLSSFGRGEADILVGTQVVAKGLDFPNVTVVGVINSDTELAFPSYRNNERMYQLLSQVAGRSGRSAKKGVVFLQTRQPDHFTLKHAREHDFEGFAKKELELRKNLLYPPYSRLLTFRFKGKNGDLVRRCAETFTRIAQACNAENYPILGPSPDVIERIKQEFRWVTMIKMHPRANASHIEKYVDYIFENWENSKPEGSSAIRITVAHEMI